VGAGGVDGGRSSGLAVSSSRSLSEHNEGVGASVIDEDPHGRMANLAVGAAQDRDDCEDESGGMLWFWEELAVEVVSKLASADGTPE